MEITRMKAERMRKGWSQEYLGQLVGLTKGSISRLETLQRKPSYNVLLKLHTIFNLSNEELFQQINVEDPFPSPYNESK